MNGRSCPNQESLVLQTVQQHFQQTSQTTAKTFTELHWDHFVLNHPRFTGGLTSYTITRFVSQQLGVPALQIELCSTIRVVQQPLPNSATTFRGQPQAIQQTMAWLQDLVETLATAV
jgi:hypothetical protein